MQLRFLAKALLLSMSVVVIVFSVIVIFFPVFNHSVPTSYLKPTPSNVSTSSPVVETAVGFPTRLQIPSIKVDASIERVGVNSKGEMDIPKLPGNTAWFDLGARPGQIGTAAIAGHLNWYNGATGVFANLNKLNIGDEILVQDDKGQDISFVVKKIRTYNPNEDASDVFISNDNKAHLNLITCDGVWDKRTKQYSKRLVVFAEKE
jgi:LPXTG-site transpeptidase (sortase) family protein